MLHFCKRRAISICLLSTRTTSSMIHASTFYEAVKFLAEGGFRIFFCLFDGAPPSRSFFHSQLHGKSDKFFTITRTTRDPLFLILDHQYAYITLNYVLFKKYAVLISLDLQSTGHTFFSFWYIFQLWENIS